MPRFKARSSAHMIRKRYVCTQVFFRYGDKNIRFRKCPATRGRSFSFLNTEEKISVFENTRLRVYEALYGIFF